MQALLVLLFLLQSWWQFLVQCEDEREAAEDFALRRSLETMDEDELRRLLDE